MSQFVLDGQKARYVRADGDEPKTVTVLAGDSAYYGPQQVTPVSNDGQVTSGGSVNLTSSRWFVSAGSSLVGVEDLSGATEVTNTVRDYGAAGDGATPDNDAFNAAQAAGGHIVVPPGQYLLTGDHALSAGRWNIAPGATLLVADGDTLTVSADIDAGHHQIFGGWAEDDEDTTRAATADDRARIVFTRGQVLYPEWFGATGDGTANDKPAWQRLLWAVPTTVPGVVQARLGATYLFTNDGVSEGTADDPERNSTAESTGVNHLTIDLNGSILKAADDTRYSLLLISGTDSATPAAYDSFTIRNGTLDGNRAGNEAQWVAEGDSEGNKGHGALVKATGYREARCVDMKVKDTIHSGVTFQNCTDSWFTRCTAEGGFPMMFEVDGDQAHYFKAEKDYAGRSFFSFIDTDGGSHGCTVHTAAESIVDASDTFVFIDNVRHLNAAEAAIHIEKAEQVFMSNFSVVIDDAEFSSGNVADVTISPGNVAESVIMVSDGVVINAQLKATTFEAAPRLVGTFSNVHVLQNLSGLADTIAFTADNYRAVNCSAKGTSGARIGDSSTPALEVAEAIGCEVDYASGVAMDVRTGAKGGRVTNTDGTAVRGNGLNTTVADVEIDTATDGFSHETNAATFKIHGCTAKNISHNCVVAHRPTTVYVSRSNVFRNFGTDTGATNRQRAAIGGASGAVATTLISKGDIFWNDGTNANAYTVALDRNGTTPTFQDFTEAVLIGTTGPAAPSVASAAALTLPGGNAPLVDVTGTTSITSITAQAGRKVTLRFTGLLTVTDGSNLKLAGDFVTSADDTITLICDGVSWSEVSRSVI